MDTEQSQARTAARPDSNKTNGARKAEAFRENGVQSPIELTQEKESQESAPSKQFSMQSEGGSDWQSGINTRLTDLDKTFRAFVKTKPVVAAACAVGLGFAASLIFARLDARKKTSDL